MARSRVSGFNQEGFQARRNNRLGGLKYLAAGLIAAIIFFSGTASPVRGEANKPPAANDKVAVVNGDPIGRGEFDEEVMRIERALLQYGKPLTAGQVTSIRKEVIEAMVRREILYQDGVKSGIKADEEAIDKELKTLRQQFSTETEFKSELSRRNMSEETLRTRLEKNSLIQKYIDQRFAAKITVSDNDMVDYYQSHIDAFKVKATDKKPETVLAYEGVKDKIRQFLRDEKARQEADQEAAAFRKKADVEIFVKEDNTSR